MTIREKVALVIAKKTNISCGAAWDFTDPIITAFLAAAAEQGWRMRRDTISLTMANAYGNVARKGLYEGNAHCAFDHKAHRAMLAAAPKFEWDK